MNKTILAVTFSVWANLLFAQNRLDWTADRVLHKSDFQAEAPNNGKMQTVFGNFILGYEIVNYQLITVKNLNSKVFCYFQKDASFIDSGDSISTQGLLRYQQLIFDIYELSARQLRQKFITERKRLLFEGAPKLHEEISVIQARTIARLQLETENGSLLEKILEWENWIDIELEKLKDYCKECKPQKKKSKTNT